MTRTSVVILNYNGEALLRKFLPSVVRYSSGAEIVVADNGSSDQSLTVLRNEFPEVRVIALGKNFGFCGGYNRALSQVNADFFLLLNSDVEVTADWLKPLESILINRPDVDAVQPKILCYPDTKKFEYAGAAGGFIDAFGYPFCRGRVFDKLETDEGQYDDEREIFWATGACFLIRSGTFRKFGGFDEDFFAHMEEIDLCWKINRSGQKVFYTGKSSVHHQGAGTLGYDNPRKTFLNFRNGLFLIIKHFDTFELMLKLPVRICLDWLAALVYVLKGKFQSATSVLKAHVEVVKNLGNIWTKRKALKHAYPSYSRQNVHPGMIIFDFYLRKKKKYADQ